MFSSSRICSSFGFHPSPSIASARSAWYLPEECNMQHPTQPRAAFNLVSTCFIDHHHQMLPKQWSVWDSYFLLPLVQPQANFFKLRPPKLAWPSQPTTVWSTAQLSKTPHRNHSSNSGVFWKVKNTFTFYISSSTVQVSCSETATWDLPTTLSITWSDTWPNFTFLTLDPRQSG